MSYLASIHWPALALFAGALVVASLYGLALSGHFPAEHRKPDLRLPGGTAVIWGTAALALAAVGVAIVAAARALPWPVAVIAGGTAILVAPLILQHFPDRFVDGRRGLLLLASGSAVLAAALSRLLA